MLTATVARDRDRDFIRFFRQIVRHFVGSSADFGKGRSDLVGPSGLEPLTSTVSR